MSVKKAILATFVLSLFLFFGQLLYSQSGEDAPATAAQVDEHFEALRHRLDELEKAVDDVLWHHRQKQSYPCGPARFCPAFFSGAKTHW